MTATVHQLQHDAGAMRRLLRDTLQILAAVDRRLDLVEHELGIARRECSGEDCALRHGERLQ